MMKRKILTTLLVAMLVVCAVPMMVLAEGLKAAGADLKADDIMAGMKAVKEMPLATGNITIDDNGDANRDILIIRLCEGGAYELVK